MKEKRKYTLSVIIAMLLFVLSAGCGTEESVIINEDLSAKVVVNFYTTNQEEKELEKDLEMPFKDFMKEAEYTYVGKQKIGGVEHNSYQNKNNLSKKDAKETFAALTKRQGVLHVGDIFGELESNAGISLNNLDYAALNIKYPFKVYKTNGTLQKDGYTVQYTMNKLKKAERIYAVSDAKSANTKKCTISGVKNNGYYRKNVTVTAKSEGVITSFKVNRISQPANNFRAEEEGTYTVKVKLLAGNTKTVKFIIDKTKPTTNVKDKTYKNTVKVTFADKNSGVKNATLNGKNIKSGTVVSKKGSYVLKITDKAGNTKTVKFTVK